MTKTLKMILIILVFGIIVLGGTTVQAISVPLIVNNATDIQKVLGGEDNAEVLENTVKLKRDITIITKPMQFSSGTVILDLNGKTLTIERENQLFVITGGELTVKDSTNSIGKITNNSNKDIFYLDTQGKLTIENGIFNSENGSIIGVSANDEEEISVPTLIIKEGTFKAQSSCIYGFAGNITIDNGKFESLNHHALHFRSDAGNLNATINNCETIGCSCVWLEGGSLTINDGNFVSSEGNAIYIDNRYNSHGTNNKIIINGGTYSTSGAVCSCLYINMFQGENYPMDVIINGGTFIAEKRSWDGITIFRGNLEINGGTFISKLNIAVEQYNGILKINGGTFSGKRSGLCYDPINIDVTLKGGKYEALETVGEDNYGGICTEISKNIKPTENLGSGYEIYEDATIVEYDGFYCTKSPVTIELHRYNITVNESENGTVTLAKGYASKNEIVTITTTPSNGYKLKSITVTTESGANVEVLNNKFTMPEGEVVITAVFEEIPYTITMREMQNGTITADKETALPGKIVALTVTPNEGYKLKEIKILDMYDEMPVTLKEDNKFTMPSYNVFILAEFELIYSEKTITKTEESSTVSIKGTFSGNPKLVITKIEEGNEGYNSLIKLVKEDKEIIGFYEVSVEGGEYAGKLELTFTVGNQYEGDLVTIYHKKANGEVETKTATVKDGKVTIIVDELSPFMLVTDKRVVEQKDETPKTGNDRGFFIGISMLIIELSIGRILIKRKIDK